MSVVVVVIVSFPGKAVGLRVGGKGAPVVAAPAKDAMQISAVKTPI